MEIALIVAAGLSVMTLIAAGFDYLGKRSKRADSGVTDHLKKLESRIAVLEASSLEKDGVIQKLETEMQFLNKLLVDKTEKK